MKALSVMTPADFIAALSHTRLREHSAEAARLQLVEDLTGNDAARLVRQLFDIPTFGESAARNAKYRIMRAWRKMSGCPDDWRIVTLCAPAEMATEFEEEAWEARKLADDTET